LAESPTAEGWIHISVNMDLFREDMVGPCSQG